MENGQRYILTLINVIVVVVALAVDVLLIMFLDPSRESMALVATFSALVGSFIIQNSNSQQWWFGTTKGTADTTATIRDIAVGAPQPPTTLRSVETGIPVANAPEETP